MKKENERQIQNLLKNLKFPHPCGGVRSMEWVAKKQNNVMRGVEDVAPYNEFVLWDSSKE